MTTDEVHVIKELGKVETYRFSKRHGLLIDEIQNDFIKVVHRPDCTPQAIIEFRRYLNLPLRLIPVTKDEFTKLLTKNFEKKAVGAFKVAEELGDTMNLQDFIQEMPTTTDLLEGENDAPVIHLINALMREAIKQGASDIHFETFENTLAVRFRIDGVLRPILDVPHLLAVLIVSRIKVLAKLDISEKRLPQDGRISVKIAGRTVNIRVSSIPVSHGERVVLRILDAESVHLNLTDLGMDTKLLAAIKRMISKPNGIILVTGPTGSGKTTTLYAMLSHLNVPGRNIMTVEDPIEYDLAGIAQIQVNPKVEMTFARSLRAILRQDPNVVMVGEIRDLETAVISVQASLTGHLVLSTLHTNTAVGAITRLRDMGVESYLLSSSLIGVIAQRLIRLLCSYCKEPYLPDKTECKILGIRVEDKKTIYHPRGCEHCNHTGYNHRLGIFEVVEIDDTFKTLIHENASEQKLDAYAREESPSIWQNSCAHVLSGETSLEEIDSRKFDR